MASYVLLLELEHVGGDFPEFSGFGWFMRFLLAGPADKEQYLMITVSTNLSCCHRNFEIQ